MPRKPKETESLEEIKPQAEVSISSAEEKQSPATSTVSHATPKGKATK